MDELLTDPRLHSGLVAGLVAFGVWLVKREVRRIDQGLANAVKRSELEQLREDVEARHGENRDTLRRIETGVTDTHRRIDDLYRDLMNLNNGNHKT